MPFLWVEVLKFFHEFSRDGSQNRKKHGGPPPLPTVKKPVSILKPPRKYLPADAPVKKSTFYLELTPPLSPSGSRCGSEQGKLGSTSIFGFPTRIEIFVLLIVLTFQSLRCLLS